MRIRADLRSNVHRSRSRRAALASCLALGLFALMAPGAGAVVFGPAGPITIPASGNATPYPSTITVTGLTGTITDVNVTLTGLSHTAIGDVIVVLVPPPGSGHNIVLMHTGGDNPVSNVNLTFDDGAQALPANTTFSSGTYKPTFFPAGGNLSLPAPGPGDNYCSPGGTTPTTPSFVGGNCTLAQALNGSDPNGTWSLFVRDIFGGDSGSIASWSLDITAGGPATTAHTLTVNTASPGSGTGTGTVRGLGISCPRTATVTASCSESYNSVSGNIVTLTATPTGLSTFAGWSGDPACAGSTAPTCTVTVNAAKNVTATFNPGPRSLNVGKTGSGTGTLTGVGINCGADCTQTYQDIQSVSFTATPAPGSGFAGWIGCDTPNGNTCTVNMTANKNVTARFAAGYPLPPAGPGPSTPSTLAGCAPGRNVITLGPGNDVRNGTNGNDLIFAGAGNDLIGGLAGDDCLDLGPGNDRAQAGPGHDLVLGGLGDDAVAGAAGNDRLRGDAGADNVNGDAGNDDLLGGIGVDRLFGGAGNDRMHGQDGGDTISGSSGSDRINGGAANDTISGGSSADRIAGDQGNDRINGNGSGDSLSGNSGRDRITGGSGRDRISAGAGGDRISARDRTRDRINCGSGRDRVTADRIDRVARNCERVSRR